MGNFAAMGNLPVQPHSEQLTMSSRRRVGGGAREGACVHNCRMFEPEHFISECQPPACRGTCCRCCRTSRAARKAPNRRRGHESSPAAVLPGGSRSFDLFSVSGFVSTSRPRRASGLEGGGGHTTNAHSFGQSPHICSANKEKRKSGGCEFGPGVV